MLIVFTGNGKGKTTAAIGQGVRAAGNGSRVLMVQFIKGPWKSGEDEAVKRFEDSFVIEKRGRGFVKIAGDMLPFEEHVRAAKDALGYALEQAESKKWNIIILDEVWVALGLDLLKPAEVSSFIDRASPLVDHIIMTGRGCPQAFIDRADLVTEMREVKHPFANGTPGEKGVEY